MHASSTYYSTLSAYYKTCQQLIQALCRMLQAVDRCPVTRCQKLYKLGICPRLNWPLTIHEFSISWMKHELEAMATRFLKRWAGLAKSANPNLLYLPKRDSGLDLPSSSFLYKQCPAVSEPKKALDREWSCPFCRWLRVGSLKGPKPVVFR